MQIRVHLRQRRFLMLFQIQPYHDQKQTFRFPHSLWRGNLQQSALGAKYPLPWRSAYQTIFARGF